MERLRYKKTTQDISVNKYLSIYPYLLLFKSTTVEKCSWKIVFLGNICLLFHMLFFPAKFLKNICRFFYSHWTSTVCNFTKSWSTSQTRFLQKQYLAEVLVIQLQSQRFVPRSSKCSTTVFKVFENYLWSI